MADAEKLVEFAYYKPGQGTWARWTAGILLGFLVLFGAHSLYNFPDMDKYESGKLVGESFWGKRLSDLPGVERGITPGLIIAVLVFAAGLTGLYLFVVNGKRAANFLIDTEAEMHKVSWPPRHEYVGSSIVVMVSVVIIGGYVAVVDAILQIILTKTGLI